MRPCKVCNLETDCEHRIESIEPSSIELIRLCDVKNKMVVVVSPSGQVTYGEGWDADSASKYLFEALGGLAKFSFDAGLRRAAYIVRKWAEGDTPLTALDIAE